MTPEQQEEFEKAVQQHIQLAVNAALANMPQQPPQPAAVPAVTVNQWRSNSPSSGQRTRTRGSAKRRRRFTAPTSPPRIQNTTTC